MKIEQIYTGCLAEAAYYIESNGEAAIIDPLRETRPYIERAEKDGAKIKYIFETHFHADFVSGHIDLAKKTGGQIVFGPNAETTYEMISATDGQIFNIGKVRIKVIHTPGHTMESSCFLLIDEQGKETALFSGDTLFIGDVGRPDLAIKSDVTQDDLAGMLFDSLRDKVMVLPDDMMVYPGHGAGSACGKNMSKETWDTLGHQKEVNYALRANMTKAEFIKEVTEGIAPPPQYFAKNAQMNKTGYENFDHILARGNVALDPATFEAIANHEGAIVLDTRSPKEFAEGHIPNSIFIGINGSFAPWVGALINDLKQAIIIVADKGKEEEVILRLSRVGYDNTLGFLEGGIEAWRKEGKDLSTMQSIEAGPLAEKMKNESLTIVDARKPSEFLAEHVEDAISLPLDYINDNMSQLSKDKTAYVHCKSGYRSTIFISILMARGYENLVNINGGFDAILNTDINTTDYVCPTTLSNN